MSREIIKIRSISELSQTRLSKSAYTNFKLNHQSLDKTAVDFFKGAIRDFHKKDNDQSANVTNQ